MRWRKHRPTKADDRKEREDALREAEEALREAEDELEAVRERTSEIVEITRTLRKLRERNHFAPLVWDAIGGNPE